MKKRIGIDARLYFQTGVGVYLRNFLHNLEKQELKDIEIYVYILSEESDRVQFSHPHFVKRTVDATWHSFAEQIQFLHILYKDNLDLMHFTYFSYPILYKRRFIATVHDVILLQEKTGRASTRNPLHYEIKYQVFKQVIASQLRHAAAIITPTQTVKQQIVSLFGIKYAEKIHPIYEGIDYELQTSREPELLKQKVTDRYFLYVGNFYPHKNVDRLLMAFKKIAPPTQLFLIGPKNFFSERTAEMIRKLGLEDRVKLYLNAPTNNLAFFYRHAVAFVSPSLAEGFGLPLLEAAHFRLPIVASDIPVFHELLGEDYISFNPRDVDDMSYKIQYQLDHLHPLYKAEQLKKFSFATMTEQILELYAKVLT